MILRVVSLSMLCQYREHMPYTMEHSLNMQKTRYFIANHSKNMHPCIEITYSMCLCVLLRIW
jgi:hypothetical protein